MYWLSNREQRQYTLSLNSIYQYFAAKTGGLVPEVSVLDPVLISIFTSRKEINLNFQNTSNSKKTEQTGEIV